MNLFSIYLPNFVNDLFKNSFLFLRVTVTEYLLDLFESG